MRSVLCLFAFLPAAAWAQAAPGRAFQLSDWYRVTTVGQPAISPDGSQVAFTVTTVREAENRRHAEVWLVAADGRTPPRRLTSPDAEGSAPRWSPSGDRVIVTVVVPGQAPAMLAYRPGDPSAAPERLERWQAGSMPADRTRLVWSAAPPRPRPPATQPDPYATMGMSRPPYGAITRPADPRRFDGRQIIDFPFRSNNNGYLPPRTGPRVFNARQLFVGAADGSAPRQLTWTAYSHNDEVVSPDGRWIAFTADASLRSDSAVAAERDSIGLLPYDEARQSGPQNDVDLYVIPTTPCPSPGCAPRRVARLVGNESNLDWSPDSRRVSFTARATRYSQEKLYVIDAAGGTPVDLTGDWRYEPGSYVWRPDGSILLSAAIGGRTAILRLDPATKARTELVGGRRRLSGFSFDHARSRVAFVATSVNVPTELYVADADGRNERQLTRFNDRLNVEVAWSDAERFTFESVGGREIEGWLMKPFGYQSGRRYPLVLYIHGGPHSAYGEGWFDEFQNLAGAGFMVLFTNPRGSSGYGADFTYSIRGRWGDEDYLDLMKAVDLMVQRPDVDSTRLGVTGGSYGGFMTGWITAKTNRFRAAQVDRADMNWVSWYGGSDQAQGLTESELFGKPWENWALYDGVSPIRYVDKVRTPTLIVHSEEDYRVTIGQGDEWFTALRKQGVPVEFIRYPRSSHELSRSGEPWLLVDRLGRLRDWFTHWLMSGEPGSR